MAHALSRYLTEFQLDPADDERAPRVGRPVPARATEPLVDMDELIRAAEERIRRQMQESHRQELEAVTSLERKRAEENLAAERRRWSESEAERLAEQFSTAFQDLEKSVASSVARILVPFLTEAWKEQVLAELETTLRALLTDKQHAHLRVSGPEDILATLSSRLEGYGSAIEFAVNSEPDVKVLANDTIIETQLNAWASRLAEAVKTS